jgi:hypothetical protein
MLEQSGELDRLLDRHVAFWEHRLDQPLLDIDNYVPLLPNPDVPLLGARRAVEGTQIFPEDLDLDAMFRQWPVPYVALNGDYLREATPYGLCWMEGLLGARVVAASGSIWAEPMPFDWSRVGDLRRRLSPENAWYAKLREYVGRLADEAGGRVPVTQTLMRGPIDIAEAIVGSEELGLALYDHPAEVEELLTIGTDAFLMVGNLFPEVAPPWRGGRSIFGIWAPGTVIRMQADHAALLSPASYRQWCFPHDVRLAAAYDYSFIHVHSGCTHIIDVLCDVPELDAVEIAIDPWPSAPRLSKLLPRLAKVLEAGKSLLIEGGPVSRDELDLTLKTLPHAGLALKVRIGSTWD